MNAVARNTQHVDGLIWAALAVIAMLAGAWLRVYQIGSQLLIDDEWQAVHRLLHADALDILSHFGVNDYSIPLTLYDRGLMELGALSELGMRLPMLFAGVALLILVPLLMRGWANRPVRVMLVGLLAISPLHVYLSRTARPYAVVSLLSFMALIAFRRWWRGDNGSPWWAVLYLASTALAAWLHLLSVVFTLVPFAFYGCAALLDLRTPSSRASARAGFVRLLRLGVACAILLALLLLPPLLGDWDALASKARAGTWDAGTLWRSLLMMFGTGSSWIGALMLMLALVGVARVWQRDRERAAYVLGGMLAGTLAILLLQPLWIQHQGVLVRYALPALPFVLWFVAEGIDACTRHLHSPWLRALAMLAVLSLLFASGPIPGWWYKPNQFIGHARFQFDYNPRYNPYLDPALLPDLPMPGFLRGLASEPPASVTLVIAPWIGKSNEIPGPWYQPVHRQWVKAGMLSGLCDEPRWSDFPESAQGIDLRNAVHVSALLRGEIGNADYLVMRRRPWTIPPSNRDHVPWPDMSMCMTKIRAGLGMPVYRDAQIVVFALAR